MKRAFTLIELMVAVFIMVITFMILSTALSQGHRNRYAIVAPIVKQQ